MADMASAVAAHRAAWQAFQDAPEDERHPDTIAASFDEQDAMRFLLRAIPTTTDDVLMLKAHLDWWVVEEDQRRNIEPELFALHAALELMVELTIDTMMGVEVTMMELAAKVPPASDAEVEAAFQDFQLALGHAHCRGSIPAMRSAVAAYDRFARAIGGTD